ncbi:MAG: radical SAM protein, partial [Acidobacteriota bacterium]
LDWERGVDRDAFSRSVSLAGIPIQQTDFWKHLDADLRWEISRRTSAFMLSNFLHGEQGALMVAAQLVNAEQIVGLVVDLGALGVEHANQFAEDPQRCRHLGTASDHPGDVALVAADVGDQRRLAGYGHATSDTLPEGDALADDITIAARRMHDQIAVLLVDEQHCDPLESERLGGGGEDLDDELVAIEDSVESAAGAADLIEATGALAPESATYALGAISLVEAILESTSIPWIRFLYAYPSTLDEGLFDLMGAEDRFLSYLDIPLQHADRTVLKAMKRGGDAASFRRMIEAARTKVPDLAVRTTFIVGFPGEGDAEFAALESFVEEVQFDHMGAFTYSWQEENPGAELGDPVSQELKVERLERLMELQQPISRELNQQQVGRVLQALVEGPLEEMELLTAARLGRQAPEIDGRLLINDGTAPAGSLVEVEITEAHPYDLIGTMTRVIDGVPESFELPVLG